MKKFLASLVLVCAMATTVYAGPAEGTYFSSGVTNTTPAFDAYGTVVRPIGGGPVNMLTVASGVTTNTSSTPVAGVSGIKNFQWVITGTGSITQTAVLLAAAVLADVARPVTAQEPTVGAGVLSSKAGRVGTAQTSIGAGVISSVAGPVQ